MSQTGRIAMADVTHQITQCSLGREHFRKALVHPKRNPLNTRIIWQAQKYKWSRTTDHIDSHDITDFLNTSYWNRISSKIDWCKSSGEIRPENIIEQIRLNTTRGKPLVCNPFFSKIKKVLNRRLRTLTVGSPKKRKKNKRSYGRGNCPNLRI